MPDYVKMLQSLMNEGGVDLSIPNPNVPKSWGTLLDTPDKTPEEKALISAVAIIGNHNQTKGEDDAVRDLGEIYRIIVEGIPEIEKALELRKGTKHE